MSIRPSNICRHLSSPGSWGLEPILADFGQESTETNTLWAIFFFEIHFFKVVLKNTADFYPFKASPLNALTVKYQCICSYAFRQTVWMEEASMCELVFLWFGVIRFIFLSTFYMWHCSSTFFCKMKSKGSAKFFWNIPACTKFIAIHPIVQSTNYPFGLNCMTIHWILLTHKHWVIYVVNTARKWSNHTLSLKCRIKSKFIWNMWYVICDINWYSPGNSNITLMII